MAPSHAYVTKTLSGLMGKPLRELNNIVCHLGNGSSITAVKGGRGAGKPPWA